MSLYVAFSVHVYIDFPEAMAIPIRRWVGPRGIWFPINRLVSKEKFACGGGLTTTRSGWQALDCLGESLTAVRCIFKAAAVQLANGAQSTCRGSIHRIAMKDAVSAQRVEISVQCHLWPTLWSEEIRFILDVLNPMNLAGPQRCS
jgi:hypothetical protein